MFLFPARTVHEAFDAVFQMNNVKVYKQSEGFATEFEVGEDLSLMHRADGIDRLEFHNHQVFDKQVDPIPKSSLTPS